MKKEYISCPLCERRRIFLAQARNYISFLLSFRCGEHVGDRGKKASMSKALIDLTLDSN